MIEGPSSWHTPVVLHARLSLSLVLASLALAACQAADEPEPVVEVPGQPLDQASFCPDVEVGSLQRFARTELWQLGACGDAVLRTDEGWTLVPIDGSAEPLAAGTGLTSHQLSPRGRLLLSHDYEADTVELRELGKDGEHGFELGEDARSGFVISKHGAGAQAWVCDAGELDLLVDGQRAPLAAEVECETVASSPMHSQLVFATVDQQVVWVDTDAGTLTPVALEDFEHAAGSTAGVRKDRLRMADSGPYLIHQAYALGDNDGVIDELPIDDSLFDLATDTLLIAHVDDLYRSQASVFGAPLFVTVAEELFGIRDGAMSSIATGINPYRPHAAIDGSVVTLDADGAIARYSGDAFEVREVEIPAAPENRSLMLSPDGQAGVTTGTTQLCATPACERQLVALRSFSPSGPGPQLLSASPWVLLHVFDGGSVLSEGAVVDGPLDVEGELPTPQLLLIAADGEVVASWEHDPDLIPNDPVTLADGRVVLGLHHFQLDSQLLIVDAAARTIAEVEGFDPGIYEIERLAIDGLGKRLAIQLSGTGGVAWGELP